MSGPRLSRKCLKFTVEQADEWLDDMRVYLIFNSISVISGQWIGDNEMLYALKPLLRMKMFPNPVGLEPVIGRSAGLR